MLNKLQKKITYTGNGRKWWMSVWCLTYSGGILNRRFMLGGFQAPRRCVLERFQAPNGCVPADGNYYKYELSVLHQLPIINLDLLIYGCMYVEMYTMTHT